MRLIQGHEFKIDINFTHILEAVLLITIAAILI